MSHGTEVTKAHVLKMTRVTKVTEVTKVTHFHLRTIATKFLSNTSRPQSKFLSCQGGDKTEMISRGGAGLSLTLLHLRAALAHISVQVGQLWVF